MVACCRGRTAPGVKGVAAGGGAEGGGVQERRTQKVGAASQAGSAAGGTGGRARANGAGSRRWGAVLGGSE